MTPGTPNVKVEAESDGDGPQPVPDEDAPAPDSTSLFRPEAGDDSKDMLMVDVLDGTTDAPPNAATEMGADRSSPPTSKASGSKKHAPIKRSASSGKAGRKGRAGGVRKKGGAGKKKTATAPRSKKGAMPHIKRELDASSRSGNDGDDDDDGDDGGVNDDDDDDNDDDTDASDSGPYCICRGPDDHRWMIQCDHCEDWFHGDCVQINKEDGENLITSYICPNCAIPDYYVTRYRKLCSLPGCRRAARLFADDGIAAIDSVKASHFCSDEHCNKWWRAMLERIVDSDESNVPEDKMEVDQFTPAQLVKLLSHAKHEPNVAMMLLHGLPDETNANYDEHLATEERILVGESVGMRRVLTRQIAMCRKMLMLLDMAKLRSQEATRAGYLGRDCCGYDMRLDTVCVQPHFSLFLNSPEGKAIFGPHGSSIDGEFGALAGDEIDGEDGPGDNDDTDGYGRSRIRLGAPRFDSNGRPLDTDAGSGGGSVDGTDNSNANAKRMGENGEDVEMPSSEGYMMTAGMCGRRRCKTHATWFSTLARDVRMQIHEYTQRATTLKINETRIHVAMTQHAFFKRYETATVLRNTEGSESFAFKYGRELAGSISKSGSGSSSSRSGTAGARVHADDNSSDASLTSLSSRGE